MLFWIMIEGLYEFSKFGGFFLVSKGRIREEKLWFKLCVLYVWVWSITPTSLVLGKYLNSSCAYMWWWTWDNWFLGTLLFLILFWFFKKFLVGVFGWNLLRLNSISYGVQTTKLCLVLFCHFLGLRVWCWIFRAESGLVFGKYKWDWSYRCWKAI